MVEKERVLRWLGVVLVGTAVVMIGLVAAGVFDPRPNGRLQWERSPGPRRLPAGGAMRAWLPETVTDAVFSVRVTAVHLRGALDSGYGLLLGDDARALAVAVAPTGYVAIWHTGGAAQAPTYMLPWQTWPHVRRGAGAVNEIWVDVHGAQATVRINRELLWQGAAAPGGAGVGLWGRSWGETAVVDFRRVAFFAPDALP